MITHSTQENSFKKTQNPFSVMLFQASQSSQFNRPMMSPLQSQLYPRESQSYRLLDQIAGGESTAVYKAICIPLDTVVAVKAIDVFKSRPGFYHLRREALTLSHPNLLTPHCSFVAGHRIWVVMPFFSGGSLRSSRGLPETHIAAALRATLNALLCLHGEGHFHGDVKPGNILVHSDCAVALADFGSSASNYERHRSYSSLYWVAPEVAQSPAADIWSLGVTALELAHGRPPLSVLPASEPLIKNMITRFWFSVFQKQSKDKKMFSDSFKEMVGSCIHQDPTRRPSAAELLNHSFFKNCEDQVFLEGDAGRFVKEEEVVGWSFNKNGFGFDPVLESEEAVDSESDVEFQETDSDVESDESSERVEMMIEKRGGGEEQQVVDMVALRQEKLRQLLWLKKNLEMQREEVNFMIDRVSETDRSVDVVDTLRTQLEDLRRQISGAAAAVVPPTGVSQFLRT